MLLSRCEMTVGPKNSEMLWLLALEQPSPNCQIDVVGDLQTPPYSEELLADSFQRRDDHL